MYVMRNDDFYDPKKPVLFLGVNAIMPLTRALEDIVRAAKDLGASIAIVEQRYTGTSWPKKDFSVGTLRKLFTVPQSVQDVVVVGQNIKSSLPGIRIILFGCSAGGTVAALARKYYPLTFDGAILSSAPLKFQLENPEYGHLKEAHSAIGEKLASPEGRRQLEKTFDIHEGDLETREAQTTLTLLGQSTGLVVQNNDPLCKGEYCKVKKVCKKLTEGGDADPWYPSSIFKEGEGPEVQMVGDASHCYWCNEDDENVLKRIRSVIQKWLE
ncbi:Thymus-specific serine protease [Perkinsus chesapeaki]|uniref:Thymus-specific serine protease n=1 Tax=Perkinsus chesapeaki TaxID=330153 RepID=A0A7J6MVI5_PERCH|nr:Thymus-specific serine protease [Perkinsus chesapeaki]